MTKKDNYPNLLKNKNHAQIIMPKKRKKKKKGRTHNNLYAKLHQKKKKEKKRNQVYHTQKSKIKKESKKTNKINKEKEATKKSITPRKAKRKEKKKEREKKLLIGLVKGGMEDSLVIDYNYSSPHYFLPKLERKNFDGAREKHLRLTNFQFSHFL